MGDSPSAPTNALTFNNIRGFGKSDAGRFRIMGDLFGWKNGRTQKVHQYDVSRVTGVSWARLNSKECCLMFSLKDDDTARFYGFKESDHDGLARHLRIHWKIDLQKTKLATRGWHWGEYQLLGKSFVMDVDGKRAFFLDASDAAQVTVPSKTDLAISFSADDQKSTQEDRLVELRLYVVPGKDGDPMEHTGRLKEALVARSGISMTSSEGFMTVNYAQLLMPPGRFDIHIQKGAFKLHGKSSDFTILYKSISLLFLLPNPSQPHHFLVMTLDGPLRKGQTRYPNVVVQFDSRKQVELNLAVTDEEVEELQKKDPTFTKRVEGNEYEVVTRLITMFAAKAVLTPTKFKSASANPCIRCSHKAASGFLYPLDRMFIFVPKPVIVVRYDEILSVDFGRTSGAQTRLFEFKVAVKGGNEVEFSSVDRQEHGTLVTFLQSKNVRIRQDLDSKVDKESFLADDLPSDTDESDDEDFEAHSEESDEEVGSVVEAE